MIQVQFLLVTSKFSYLLIFSFADKKCPVTKYPGGICAFILFIFQVRNLQEQKRLLLNLIEVEVYINAIREIVYGISKLIKLCFFVVYRQNLRPLQRQNKQQWKCKYN